MKFTFSHETPNGNRRELWLEGTAKEIIEVSEGVLDKFKATCAGSTTYTVEENTVEDGLYYVYADGDFSADLHEAYVGDVVGIGVKQGEQSFLVLLTDAAEGEVTLTDAKDQTAGHTYLPRECDALYDWNGAANTDHLRTIGLNPAIKLNDGEYIPALAQLVAIAHNITEINAMLSKIPEAKPLVVDGWYWSSTEYSQTYAWFCYLNHGGIFNYAKATLSYRVRPVSAFKFIL